MAETERRTEKINMHATEYLLIGLSICLLSLGAGMFAESTLVGFSSSVFMFILLGIWIYVRENDL